MALSAHKMQNRLLDWYDRHQRVLPWRAAKGRRPDPYHVWLSEIMLQQTTVVTVGPYFQKFLSLWPRIQDLAEADLDDVLAVWAGLGYYARARNLHKCAKAVVAEHKGKFPQTVEGLLTLPGIGPYTAAAIASIAFDNNATAVDGNVERVTSRVFAIEEPLPLSKNEIREKAAFLAKDVARPGDFTQAFMELGATVCTPRKPKCPSCPWRESCRAYELGIQESLPRKTPKAAKPQRFGKVFWASRANGDFLIEKRAGKGLYEGMYQLPTTEWIEDRTAVKKLASPFGKGIKVDTDGVTVRHSFTHFDLVLEIWTVKGKIPAKANAKWVSHSDLRRYALPTLMKKAVLLCMGDKKTDKG